jgi:hypothetical protein
VSASQPVDRVIQRLAASGYVELEQPITVGGIPFEFAAILARRDSLDLVVVADTIAENDHDRIRRRTEALGRALDVVGSRRTLTTVLVGIRPAPIVTKALARVARVLAVGTPTGDRADQALDDALAVLLPLAVTPDEHDQVAESWAAARAKLLEAHVQAMSVIDAASSGADNVAEALHRFVGAAFEEGDR